MITINNSLTIPHDEVELTFSRSQGPGGQNVNKVNSKVTLHWDVQNSRSISARLKQRIYSKHSGKINNDGKLVVSSQKSREQHQNRSDCYQKLRSLIEDALKTKKPRKRTKPTKASKLRRLTIKNAVVRSKQDDRDATNINYNALQLFWDSVVHKFPQIVDNGTAHITAKLRTS